MIAMLLAGGQGSRLGVLTSKVAKPAVAFGGKYRIIDFPLSNCINSGVDTVGVLTQYEPLELNARFDEELIPANSSFTWTSSDPDCLEVIPNGSSCTVKILKARQEGVTLTCKAGGYETQVTAYILEASS